MAIDPIEVENTLNEHKELLSEHGGRLQRLEMDSAVMKEQLSGLVTQMGDVKIGVADLKNTYVTHNTVQMQTLTQLLASTTNSNTQIATDVAKGRNQVDMKRIGLIGTMVTAFVTVCGLIIKAIFS